MIGWNGASDEVYFLDGDGDLAAIRLRLEDQVVVDLPKKLFPVQANLTWAAMADGERFLFGTSSRGEGRSPITLVLNWEHGL